MGKRRVLFLCTGNSARSQMAEGLLRQLGRDDFDVASAGTNPREQVNPLAVRVMSEARIDISQQRPKSLVPFIDEPWDFVITLCDRARETCPTFPREHEQIHWSFRDPAEATGDDAARTRVFRVVRDEIATRIKLFVSAHTRRAVEGDQPG